MCAQNILHRHPEVRALRCTCTVGRASKDGPRAPWLSSFEARQRGSHLPSERKCVRPGMTDHAWALILAAAKRPSFAKSLPSKDRGRREDRVRAAPAVSCAMCTKKCAHEHTGSAESIRPSLRNGFTAYSALSPATNSSCHRRLRIKTCLSPVGPTHLRKLDISNGCQDHTTSPYAATRLRQQASPGFGAVRLRAG
jgi:hypothetical protein